MHAYAYASPRVHPRSEDARLVLLQLAYVRTERVENFAGFLSSGKTEVNSLDICRNDLTEAASQVTLQVKLISEGTVLSVHTSGTETFVRRFDN